ncbi:hypothetical protein GW746_01620 [Candidatus Saccharibacteria bacterium]|nr:hypothetical protein [Candidatus Saccharibacteria bacterium]NCS83096.1 hypothetical protein [Candidatus Saccharibacteria bacterium]
MTDRSTKRQKELLDYVSTFITEHGYGPSYREIMNALGYKSVSTVAVHIDGLIAKGYVRKRDNSARSLEVITSHYTPGVAKNATKGATEAREKWLVEVINERFSTYKANKTSEQLDELYVLIGALKVLGFDGAYEAMRSKLMSIVTRAGS